jgi:hypothetical protein
MNTLKTLSSREAYKTSRHSSQTNPRKAVIDTYNVKNDHVLNIDEDNTGIFEFKNDPTQENFYNLIKNKVPVDFIIDNYNDDFPRIDTSMAAYWGHLELLKWMSENDYLFDESTCSSAAAGGYLNCLKYARSINCPWDEETCSAAAEKGSLECLEYAHINDCPWDEETLFAAAKKGNLECLEYAFSNNCPSPWGEYSDEDVADSYYSEDVNRMIQKYVQSGGGNYSLLPYICINTIILFTTAIFGSIVR